MTTVTVHTLGDGCVQCHATLAHLDKRGVPYRVVDLTTTAVGRTLADLTGHRHPPLVTVMDDDGDASTWHGYRADLIDDLAARLADGSRAPLRGRAHHASHGSRA